MYRSITGFLMVANRMHMPLLVKIL